MQSKTFLLLSFFPLFLLQSCGGGSIAFKSSDGSTISFKKENVICKEMGQNYAGNDYITCTANGVQTDLTNRQYPFSEKGIICWEKSLLESGIRNENSFACSAAKGFGFLPDRDFSKMP
tara:strand:- start:104 stop:460 length:357 start_codon:yes stop_codon:yes gene_type:complete